MSNIIFAPHCDDETIGCWTLLSERKIDAVYYFFELSEQRRIEARNCAEMYGFLPYFNTGSTLYAFTSLWEPGDTVYVPHIKDNHPHHKTINQLAKSEASKLGLVLKYYSVDMNTKELTVLEKGSQKREDLITLFPSQDTLWGGDDKYWLFESLSDTDFSSKIFIKTTFEGIHAYPAAPEGVEFLAHPHRHIFHVEIKVDVFHHDREIEFILFKREIENYIVVNLRSLQYKSCEMIAEMFLNYVICKYKKRSCSVIVSEDNENGAEVSYVY
jgi:hypothetical protein